MIRTLGFKPDFGQTIQRFEAWWQGEIVDRPLVSLQVKRSRPFCGEMAAPANQRERWMNVTRTVENAVAAMECTDYAGDSFPLYCPNLGPEITGTLFGCDIEFAEYTSWTRPVVHDAGGWQLILEMAPDFCNPYWQTIEAMTDYALEICDDRFIVGNTDLHGTYDILAALRDPQALCEDLADCPEVVDRVARKVAPVFAQAFTRLYDKVAAAGMGSSCWTPMYHEGPAYVPSCDFWCMVSPAMARDLIMPTTMIEMEPLARSIYHLDGPQALHHLDLLLESPQPGAIQWVFGEGSPPAMHWLEVYRRCLQAGKPVQVLARDATEALALFEALGARGVWMCVGAPFESLAEADQFLKETVRFAG